MTEAANTRAFLSESAIFGAKFDAISFSANEYIDVNGFQGEEQIQEIR